MKKNSLVFLLIVFICVCLMQLKAPTLRNNNTQIPQSSMIHGDLIIRDIAPMNALYTHSNEVINVTVAHESSGASITGAYIVELLIDSISRANISIDADLKLNSTDVYFYNINITTPGVHNVSAFVNKNQSVNEAAYNNNTLSKDLTWILNPDFKPDLLLTSFDIPSLTETNALVVMNITISNQGKWTTQSSSNVEIFLNSLSKWNITLPILQILESFSFSINITIQGADNFTLIIKIDSLSEIAESEETNNFIIRNLNVVLPTTPEMEPEFWNPTTTTLVILGSGIAVAASIFVMMAISRMKLPTYHYFRKLR